MISKVSLQQARRYGMMEYSHSGRQKFTHAGTIFIYDPVRQREVTCWQSRDKWNMDGSASHPPIHLPMQSISDFQARNHEQQRQQLLSGQAVCHTHTVLVVDLSGSMRRDDIRGARCRSDAVWLALARDYVQRQLRSSTASWRDTVSAIGMWHGKAEALFHMEPMDQCLYNRLVNLREWTTCRPAGPGNYGPSLTMAEEMLKQGLMHHPSIPLALLFLSDGRPSDRGNEAVQKMGHLASLFGSRLSITCIGMAHPSEGEDFRVLRSMVQEAKRFGSKAYFEQPQLHHESLSVAVSSLATSLTQSRISITSCLPTPRHVRHQDGEYTQWQQKQHRVLRTNLVRERHTITQVDDDHLSYPSEWKVYTKPSDSNNNYVYKIWKWDPEKKDFVYLMDRRCVSCYALVKRVQDHQLSLSASKRGTHCTHCKACYMCDECVSRPDISHIGSIDCTRGLEDRRKGLLVQEPEVPSFGVAIKQTVIGEGAERVVSKLRFIDDYHQFTGKRWVAKESRFETVNNHAEDARFHRECMQSQALAEEYAKQFNQMIELLPQQLRHLNASYFQALPRMEFLQPLLLELVEPSHSNGTAPRTRKVLIEERLDGQYQKFNNNMGFVIPDSSIKIRHSLSRADDRSPLCTIAEANVVRLDEGEVMEDEVVVMKPPAKEVIDIISDDGDEDEDEDRKFMPPPTQMPIPPIMSCNYSRVLPQHFPQAFSHYTYEKSGKRLIVVDLQGILVEHKDGRKKYLLTDPAIHQRRRHRPGVVGVTSHTRHALGRTDQGNLGIQAFFNTHVCTDTCRLLNLSPFQANSSHQIQH